MATTLSGIDSISVATLDGLVTIDADSITTSNIVINGSNLNVNDLFNKVTDDSDDITQGSNNLFLTPTERIDIASNTAKRHDPVSIGTANGLSLSGQQLSMGLAGLFAPGAISASTYLDIQVAKASAHPRLTLLPGASNGLVLDSNNQILSMNVASGSITGALASNDWTTFNNKQDLITGGATTITSNNLTIDRALVSDGSGKVAVSGVTSTELGYLTGATSNIQGQINALSGGNVWTINATPTPNVVRLSNTGLNVAIGDTNVPTTATRLWVNGQSTDITHYTTSDSSIDGNVYIGAPATITSDRLIVANGSARFDSHATISGQLRVGASGGYVSGPLGVGMSTVPSTWQLDVSGGVRSTFELRSDINVVANEKVGVGTYTPSSTAYLDVAKVVGNTTCKFGNNCPVYMIQNDSLIGFNTYYNSGWKRGAGANGTGRYGNVFGATTAGDVVYIETSTNAPANEGDAMTMQRNMTLDRSGNVTYRGDIYSQNGGLSLDTKITRTAQSLLANWTLSCSYRVTYQNSRIRWYGRVIAIPVTRSDIAGDGYIDILCPTSGTITYYRSDNVTTTVTCDTWGIPVNYSWQALFYEISDGQGQTSDQSRFRLCDYPNSTWRPNRNWIPIYSTNGDQYITYGSTTSAYINWHAGKRNIGYNFDNYNKLDNYYNGRGSDVLYNQPLYRFAGFKSVAPNVNSSVPERYYQGGAYDDGTYFNSYWNNRNMWAIYAGGDGGQVNANNQAGCLFIIDVYADVHNMFFLECITGDRWQSAFAYVLPQNQVNLGGNQFYALGCATNSGQNTGGVNNGNSSRPSPANASAQEISMHEHLTWCIPAGVIKNYGYNYYDSNGYTNRKCYVRILVTRHPNSSNPLWCSAVGAVGNPYGFSYVSALDMHWSTNVSYAQTVTSFQWYGNWNSETMCQIGGNVDQYGAIKLPWIDSNEFSGIYFGLVTHGDTWNGNTFLVYFGNRWFKLGASPRSHYGKMMSGQNIYRRCVECYVPRANLINYAFQNRGGSWFLQFLVRNEDSNATCYFRGAYLEIAPESISYN